MVWKRASFWTALIAVIAYCDWTALNGSFVYDDAGSVLKNVVVTGQVPWTEAFQRDFWGQPMIEAGSHKSFRPITTLTLKLNYLYAKTQQSADEKSPPTFSFHLVNVLLHGIVTGLITECTYYILPGGNVLLSQLIVGFIFGLHPVHAEVVSNITSRGELLMSLFFCLAFLSYASTLESKTTSTIGRLFGIYIIPWYFMTLSLFSKEQGATTLISLVLWDFLQHHGNVLELLKQLQSEESRKTAVGFIVRTFILAIQTVVVVLWRYMLNGETVPDFIEAQNPAGFAPDRFTRAFSVSWVYILYLRDALYPYYLCPDWSGLSIDLITTLSDPRSILVLCFWYACASSLWSLVVGLGSTSPLEDSQQDRKSRTYAESDALLRQVNMAVWAFAFSPFLLSSNILVVVGLMKADRVIYLPLFGFCLLEASLLQHYLLRGKFSMPTALQTRRQQKFWAAHFFLMYQLLLFCGKTHERNLAWSDSLRLWESAYAINPKSHHTMYNYGYELSIKQRFAEAEPVLRPIGDPRVEGPSNTFVYAMVLFNLKQCHKANLLLDEAFAVVDEKRRAGGVRNSESTLARTESNLLVARAHCTDDIQERARIMYESVQVDPSNEYAVGIATQLMEKMKSYENLQKNIRGAN